MMKMKYSTLVIACLIPLFALGAHAQTPEQMMQGMKSMQIPKQQMEMMKAMQKQALNSVGYQTDESALTAFVKKIKSVKIGEDTSDDVIRLLGKPSNRSEFSGAEQLSYMFIQGADYGETVAATVQIGTNGKVSCVKVSKMGMKGSKDIFVKGTWEMPGMATSSAQPTSPKESTGPSDHFPLKETAPDNPTEGQIYFNKTDKHAYLWNGSEWLQLDNPKINP